MEDIEALADKARYSLGPFCMSTCKAQCCRRSKLTLTHDEVKHWPKTPALTPKENGTFSLNLEHFKTGCPQLTSDNKCNIFKKPGRPGICGDFPIFVRGKTIFISSWCMGVEQKLLDNYFEQFKEKGYTLFFQ